ncbi:hypothetical protein MA16_Dca003256 [Dendrobium catenatum]|uniref:Uncharacterized protein n=1 Tax=Dendrobium catenatum TaxID=906689 RepID=A0A2I0XC89_9ASPA|nr:hypothetical protein MA16_Dca003256 [Dendrobium catenatum]
MLVATENVEKELQPAAFPLRMQFQPFVLPIKFPYLKSYNIYASDLRIPFCKSNLEGDILEAVEEEPELRLLHPFSELVQENEDLVDSIPFSSNLSEISDYTDRIECFSLPNAQALLNGGDPSREHLSEFSELCFEDDAEMKSDDVKIGELKISCSEVQSTPIKSCSSSPFHLPDGASLGHNNLTFREPEAIIVIKHFQEQIKSLEVEETSGQMNLDNVVLALATEHNASFREKYDESVLVRTVVKSLDEGGIIPTNCRKRQGSWSSFTHPSLFSLTAGHYLTSPSLG